MTYPAPKRWPVPRTAARASRAISLPSTVSICPRHTSQLPPSTALVVSTAWIMPNDDPLPWPKTISAPEAMTDAVTRLPPATSA